MIVFPNAKINIGLNITAKRPDGYHNLETVFYPVKINDALEAIAAPQLSFTSSGINIPGEPEKNLCIKAYELIKNDYDLAPLKIHLHKHIPIGAGLGGGSADAAFFIKLINEQFSLGLSVEAMQNYARQLGADCAFFIENKPVYAFDKGDQFLPVELDLSNYVIVLVMPPVHVSTAEAYAGVKPEPAEHDLQALIKLPVADWKDAIKNDFEISVFEKYPQIAAVKKALYDAGALYASMSGSGASVFGIFGTPPLLTHLEKDNQVFYNV
ncbi:4-(cytidine 5'-diphospho)-2-C-methyl-D-erythritol kinase [Mucilaginibacter sp. KACC 22063]|uniref:4-(cytidine 5'-diphospho)-2-C-methyl-D-erythritol kinase n=1 Tax=Mucilaginibacter sp. KACC 22063 TaxID=3025666 RepID=UPI0023672F17|nr:4-(cytidine 5'-diphospho)-2-C-methyl-D-erythritol kinase [Mucilaginibacter sp. KACC 22063]WDF54118.1 4-(cytidine 5'-diphospho)-2-C-methyl-D-erythritol kinase [Mucilaginibacter sp. KACC 22063]